MLAYNCKPLMLPRFTHVSKTWARKAITTNNQALIWQTMRVFARWATVSAVLQSSTYFVTGVEAAQGFALGLSAC